MEQERIQKLEKEKGVKPDPIEEDWAASHEDIFHKFVSNLFNQAGLGAKPQFVEVGKIKEKLEQAWSDDSSRCCEPTLHTNLF